MIIKGKPKLVNFHRKTSKNLIFQWIWRGR